MKRAAMAAMLSIAVLLDAGYAVAAPRQDTPKPKQANDPEKVICKSTPETGSMVRRSRQCFTRAEWTRMAQAARSGVEDIVDKNTGRPPGE